MKSQSAHISLGLYAPPSSGITLNRFIMLLNKTLQEQKLEILNSPTCVKDVKKLKEAQEEMRFQDQEMQNYGLLCGTTKGLTHLLPVKNGEGLRVLDQNEVHEYYNQHAELSIKRKQCTCDGLCSVALKLAKNILEKESISNITVEICHLSNWSHSLIRVSQINTNKKVESFFYDPWYQMCFTNNPYEPKIFSEEKLDSEMSNLMQQTNMIRATNTLFDVESSKEIENTNRDFSYFVACSNGEFTNPTEIRPDPSVHSPSFCVVS